jgi:ATP phosphoribosyltransferase-like protein
MKLKLGLPKGSLNTVGRGNTYQLLQDAGYNIEGYEPGKEKPNPLIRNDLSIDCFLVRPQSAPVEISKGILDAAIIASDWKLEWEYAGVDIKKVVDLDYGNVRIVVGAKENDYLSTIKDGTFRKPIICATEYMNIAKNFLTKVIDTQGKKISDPKLYMRGFEFGNDGRIQIIQSDGLTEGYIEKGLANIVIDNTQTGATFEKYGIKIEKVLLESSAGLYANKETINNKEKYLKLKEFADNLASVINARNSDYLVFNVRKEDEIYINNVLTQRNSFASEPTIVEGRAFAQYSILVPKNELVSTISRLKTNGAKDIICMDIRQVYSGQIK